MQPKNFMTRWNKLSLVRMGMLILVFPLILNAVLIFIFIVMVQDSERLVARQLASVRMIAAAEEVSEQLSNASWAIVGYRLTKSPEFKSTYHSVRQKLDRSLNQVRTLSATYPSQKTLVNSTLKSTEEFLKILDQSGEMLDLPPTAVQGLRQQHFKIVHGLTESLRESIKTLINQEQGYEMSQIQVQSEAKRAIISIIILALSVNSCFAGIFAVWWLRSMTSRLKLVTVNSLRLAAQLPLHPQAGGSDEIAYLDKVFHRMALTIEELTRRERATIEDAADMILSLDESLRITAANPASSKLLGRSQEEILGMRILSLVAPESSQPTLETLETIVADRSSGAIDIGLVQKDGDTVDVHLTAQWSESEQVLFCIAHNISEMKKAERLKQAVVSMVSHDIRSPLTNVMAVLEMLEDERKFGVSDANRSTLLSKARNSCKHILNLVQDLLELERLESGMLVLQLENAALAPIVDIAIDSVMQTASELQINIQKDCPPISVYVDQKRICQILINLLNNAIKFMPRKGTIKIEALETNGMAYVSVADTGRGIPPHMLHAIFDRFKQVEAGDASLSKGVGLGLSICKLLVESHGGTITCESEEGKGTKFTFSCPVGSS